MKTARIVGLVALALLCGQCTTESRVDDLVEESRLTYDRTEYFFHDYNVMPDGYGMVENLAVSDKQSIRRGRYPGSKIAFQLERVRALRLWLNARPNLKTRAVCSGLTIKLNGGKAVPIALPEQGTGLVKLDLMPGDLRPGRNEIHIRYDFSSPQQQQLAKSVSGIFLPVAFSRLIVTSLENPVRVREVRKASDLIRAIGEKKDPRGFGALLPGGRTYYVHLSGGSRLQGECRFVPVSFAKRDGKQIKIRVFLQQDESGSEEMAAELTIPPDRKFHSIHAELGEREGLARLRLSFHREDSNKEVEGVVEFASLGIRRQAVAPRRESDSARNAERVAGLQEQLRSLNTIVLLFDSARADHFSAYGYSRPTTPAMERFAGEATVFSRFYSETLTTRCSVSTLFTGYPLPITGVYHVFSRLPRELDTLAERLNRKGIRTKAVNGMGNIASEFGFGRGFDHYHDLLKEPGFLQTSQEYLPHLLPWLEKNRDERFFLYVHFKEPHSPYVPVPEFQGLFSRPFRTGAGVENSVEGQEKAGLSPERVQYVAACFDETLASADSVFAAIHSKLNQLDLLGNSMVIIIADHGEYLGEKNVFGHGISFHEPGIHVPFILHLPPEIGANFPRRVDSMVKMTDIFRTLSDIYGLPGDPDQDHGRNFLYSLFDPETEINDFVFLAKRGTPGHCVIDGRYKLIMFENGIRELYDLARDPGETRNLYHEKWIMSRYLERRVVEWLDRQQKIRERLIPSVKGQSEKGVKVHEKTLENLRSLGYL